MGADISRTLRRPCPGSGRSWLVNSTAGGCHIMSDRTDWALGRATTDRDDPADQHGWAETVSCRRISAARILRMSMPRPTAAPSRPGLRFLGLVIVIAGLFGMHGLAGHGVQGMDVVPGSALTSQSVAGSVRGFDYPAVTAEGQAVATIDRPDSLRASDAGHGDMDMSLAMMCVAILAVALLALLRSLRRARPQIIWARLRGTRVVVRPWRGPAPPSLIALSIQRC